MSKMQKKNCGLTKLYVDTARTHHRHAVNTDYSYISATWLMLMPKIASILKGPFTQKIFHINQLSWNEIMPNVPLFCDHNVALTLKNSS